MPRKSRNEPDERDIRIIRMLQKDARAPLTKIAAAVNLSIDSTKKRIQRMVEKKWFYFHIQLRPRNLGFKNIVDIKIKLRNYSEEEYNRFISYLKSHPRVAELFTVAGDFDISIVIIAKDAQDQGKVTQQIRNRFSSIIGEWNESLTTKALKFERYNIIEMLR